MDSKQFNTPLSLRAVQVKDSFWGRVMELVRKEVIPYQWEALNDRVPGAAPSWCMWNFRAAGRMMKEQRSKGKAYVPPTYTNRGFNALPDDPEHPDPERFYGFVFQDTDFSKWIEAVGYSLTQHPDPELEKIADAAIDVVCAAQTPEGYLDTYYIINGMDASFSNLKNNHELYCLGHLIEGAVAYYQATGKDKLLKAACRFVDYVDARFGLEEGKCKGYPGHEIAEMALARLYEATGNERYLALSRFFIDQRGTDPKYFLMEDQRRNEAHKGNDRFSDGSYHQAHKPVREQDEAVGHAVRAVYLYSGMADMARLTRDETLHAACGKLWRSIVDEKLYITGGIGGTHVGEAFSLPFDLPNDTAYSETCAAIGLAFFARRMLQIAPKGEYGDVMEMAFYNTILAGMALDGKSFFYVNPLAVVPDMAHRDARLSHVEPVRRKWFGCACCPPNIARAVSSIASYAYTENDDTLFTHLYLGGAIRKQFADGDIALAVESALPWEGKVEVTVHASKRVKGTLAFRMPGWCRNASIKSDKTAECRDGYAYLTGEWTEGEIIRLDLPMEVSLISADPRVRENIGQTALTRGPLTFCAEEADNGRDLHLLRMDTSRMGDCTVEESSVFGHKTVKLLVPGLRQKADAAHLYQRWQAAEEEPVTITMTPYYTWANRGEGEMRVWLRE